MFIETDRFGRVDLTESRQIDFPLGLPGFEELHQFVILEANESKPLYWLQSTQNGHIALPVIIPFEFLDDYFIEVRDHELQEMEIESQNDLLIMNVVVVPQDIKQMTANLAAPILVNAKTGVGKQIIVDAKEMPVRFPIYELIMKKMVEERGQADAGVVQKEG